ncbi:cupin-like domain-containing protein [Paraglaciecola sp.]|uniref:cupin-like domain-containing protein n=1 Tax=Paraglaciecola sp. TaxID=1920173 RepID=UPI0030F466EB
MIIEIEKKIFSQAFRNCYFESYRHQQPVIIQKALNNSIALEKWNVNYLSDKVGEAKITLLKYQDGSNDFDKVSHKKSTLADYLANLLLGNPDRTYWFNILDSGNFWCNEKYKVPINESLQVLQNDFDLKGLFIDQQLVYSQLVLGGNNVSTKLHFDWGGEAKLLTQIIGCKEVYLIHPDDIKAVALNKIFDQVNIASSPVDLWDENVLQKLASKIKVYHAIIEPGDILYWPSYWMHSVRNINDITLAINTPVDELPLSSLFIRQCFTHLTCELFNDKSLAELSPQTMKTFQKSIHNIEEQLINKAPSSLFQWSSEWPTDPFEPIYTQNHWNCTAAANE